MPESTSTDGDGDAGHDGGVKALLRFHAGGNGERNRKRKDNDADEHAGDQVG